MNRLNRMFAVMSLLLLAPGCGLLSSAAPTVVTQVSAAEQALHSYCEIAGPSDVEIAKICDYAEHGVMAIDAALAAVLNTLRARAARSLQAKAAVAGAAH